MSLAGLRLERVECVKTINAHTRGGILDLVLTSDSQYGLTCGQDGNIRLWNIWKGLQIQSYEGVHHAEVNGAYIQSCRSKFVSVGTRDSNGYQWDISTGKIIRRVGRHDLGITSVGAVPQSDDVIWTTSPDKTAAFWDLRDRGTQKRPIQTLADAFDTVTCAVATKDGDILTASLDGFLRSYDLRRGMMSADFLHHALTNIALTHDPGSQCALVTCLGSSLVLLDRSAKDDCVILNNYTGRLNGLTRLHPTLDNTDSMVISPSEDGRILFWDIGTETSSRTLKVLENAHGDGNVINGVRMIRDTDATKDRLLKERSDASDSLQMDNTSFFTFGQDGRVKVWQVK